MLDHIIKSSTPAILEEVLDINPKNTSSRRKTLLKYAAQIEALAKAQGLQITLQRHIPTASESE